MTNVTQTAIAAACEPPARSAVVVAGDQDGRLGEPRSAAGRGHEVAGREGDDDGQRPRFVDRGGSGEAFGDETRSSSRLQSSSERGADSAGAG